VIATHLARRELRVRWGRAVLASAVVAGAVALSVGLELLGRSRERAVEAELDAAGPALRILPSSTSAAHGIALRVEGALPEGAERRTRAALGAGLRRMETRSVLWDGDAGVVLALHEGVAEPAIAPGRAVIGAGVAERSGTRVGEVVRALGRSFAVGGIAPTQGDASDYATYVRAADVSIAKANELRIYLEPGVQPGDAELSLRAALPDASVLRTNRSDVADGGLLGAISAHRRAVQLVTAVVAALALLVASHLDVSERRQELALLAAMGFSQRSLASLVVLRSAACAAAGAVAGLAVAVGLAAARPAFLWAPVPAIGVAAVSLAMALASAAAAPSAISAAVRDPVRDLHDG
jgi:hypothetical protein